MKVAIYIVGGVVVVIIVGAIAVAALRQPSVADVPVMTTAANTPAQAPSDVAAVAGAIGGTAQSFLSFMTARQNAQAAIDAAENDRRQTALEAMIRNKQNGATGSAGAGNRA